MSDKRDQAYPPFKGLPPPVSPDCCYGFCSKSVFERLPTIVQKLVDKGSVQKQQVEKLILDIKENALLLPLVTGPQKELWNDPIKENKYTWSSAPWAFVEFYFYRRIYDCVNYFENKIDVFEKSKQESLTVSLEASDQVVEMITGLLKQDSLSNKDLETALYMSLWGNKADLSLNPHGFDASHFQFKIEDIKNILIDHTHKIWEYVRGLKGVEVDFVVDNVGLDVISDLILATLLLHFGYAKTAVLHIKQDPIFVSDVTLQDFHYTLDKLEEKPNTKDLAQLWKKLILEKKLVVQPHLYWNKHFPFWEMEEDIKDKFSKSALVFMKGDLNSRRLHGDLRWSFTEPTEKIMAYFPTHLVIIRTLKSETASGLSPEQLENFKSDTELKWLGSGTYGIIQYIPK